MVFDGPASQRAVCYPKLIMSKGNQKSRKVRAGAQRAREEFAALQKRAAAEPAAAPRREHITPVDISRKEREYEPLLFAIESALVEVYEERNQLIIDDEAERALRLAIARFEGDRDRRTGSPDVDAMADRIMQHIERFFRRNALVSRAEIIGCLRRIIDSISTWHTAENPRAYFDFVTDFVHRAEPEKPAPGPSGLWVPGQERAAEERDEREEAGHRRPSGLWVP